MKAIFSLLLLKFVGASVFEQKQYTIITERMEIVSYDQNYVAHAKSHNFKYNRTNFAINYTFNFKVDFGNSLKVTTQIYKFASNEYRLFPILFSVNLCTMLEENQFGMKNLFKCGNFSSCPLIKGNYYICNYAIDYTKFPPNAPPGRFMAEMKYIYRSTEVLDFQVYYIVQYPEV